MDEVDIMSSLAKPRKITIRGSNAEKYSFLVKPQDDLRKDARLMDLNSLINKLLNSNSESRRRQLREYIPSFLLYDELTVTPRCTDIRGGPIKHDVWFHPMGSEHQHIAINLAQMGTSRTFCHL